MIMLIRGGNLSCLAVANGSRCFMPRSCTRASRKQMRRISTSIVFSGASFSNTVERVEVAELSNCRMEFQTGSMARFASGSAVLTINDNAILGTVVDKFRSDAPSPSPGSGIQLSVDFRQSAAAMGRIPTNNLRREMSQSDQDVLTSRVIDRSLRPSFPPSYPAPTHIVCKPLALDDTGDSMVMGVNVASAALAVSPVPLRCIVGAARVAIVDGMVVVNPPRKQLRQANMNLIITGTDDGRTLMIEMDGKEITTEAFLECVQRGFEEIKLVTEAIKRLAAGRPKHTFTSAAFDPRTIELCKLCQEALENILGDSRHDKMSRDNAVAEVRDNWLRLVEGQEFTFDGEEIGHRPLTNAEARAYFNEFYRHVFRSHVFLTGHRCDGRTPDGLRPISIRVDPFKKLHGSSLFQRGQSQVLATVTFDSPSSAFHPDAIAQLLGAQQKKSFMLHYEFPHFAVNEIGQDYGGQNRREIGHGLLAEKALKHIVPVDFPYTIRLACQVLESNGSTSMASVCAGSLALYDAGVALASGPAAGVAIGLLSKDTKDNSEQKTRTGQSNGKDYVILTDLVGIEDYMGDIDFKIAGTSQGYTAMQLDVKNVGLDQQMLRDALQAARTALDLTLSRMNEAISTPRLQFKPSVPVLELLPLPAYRRAILFRSAAYNVKCIESETGVKVLSEDDRSVLLVAPNKEKLEEARQIIDKMFEEESDEFCVFGTIYKAEVVKVLESGVHVRLREGTRPMFMRNVDLSPQGKHASALGLSVGDRLNVQYFGRDPHTGHHRLSCRLLQTPLTETPVQSRLKVKKDPEQR